MTDFGRRPGVMLKSVYDTNKDGTVDDSAKLQGSTKVQVQDHTPKTHTHLEAHITNLVHDALKIKGVLVVDTAIADGKALIFRSASGHLVYETPAAGGVTLIDRGDLTQFDFTVGNFTTDNTWRDLDLSGKVPAGTIAVLLYVMIKDDVVASGIFFRKKGNTNEYSICGFRVMTASIETPGWFLVFCDSNRFIQYKGSTADFFNIDVAVIGYII